MMEFIGLIISGIILFILLVVGGIGFFIFKRRYKTASSNQALIITGPKLGDAEKDNRIFVDDNGRSMKIVRGGGIRLKLFQTSTPIDLTSFQLEIASPKAYTSEGVPIRATSVAEISIGSKLEIVANYAEKFLGKPQKEKERELKEVLEGHLRAIISSLTVDEIYKDFNSVNKKVKNIAEEDLKNLGFEITSFALKELKDDDEENGYLEALGRPRIAEARKDADIAEANARRETRMHKAKTDQEAEEDEIRRQIEIARSQKDKDVKEAEYKAEIEQGRARSEQSYNLEQARLNQKVKEEEMQVQYIERQRQVELEQEEQKRRKTQADSNAYDIRANAEAEAERDRIDGQTKADIEKQKGLAEAEVIRERGRAEAEAKELMAQAMENYGDAAIIEMLVEMLPKYAHEIAQPLSQISEMKVIDLGGSNSSGSTKITDNVTKTMTGLQASLKESTGMDLKAMLESFVSRGQYDSFSANDQVNDQDSKDEKDEDPSTYDSQYEVATAYEEENEEEAQENIEQVEEENK
ncbi:flotillin family protein [Anaerobacillus sp. 1_MG-2023]|uniref:flotillin family protein n=1 Tax=Anaerobacillus sp. 1_MG-2023 TaxID=3062655 RepID=UPI0026E2F76A|nr:flotillin family protein [Anaerobacillus sp. 1_MG-2023]MDO6656803.1 flotillin family protein [Anaerobacillus sp. 1_MG-2023]